jgi:hypothetical protein
MRQQSGLDGMQYERLVQWAEGYWQENFPERAYITIWASTECGNKIAQDQVKAGRKLRGKSRYDGYEAVDCPSIVPISDYGSRGKKMVLTTGAGVIQYTEGRYLTPEEIQHLNKTYRNRDAVTKKIKKKHLPLSISS